ncbi:MAG: hypothetical protein JNK49_17225 [Planctomycetes bacterium]|nr:hypothetical protein [Planctomycetota bacterium]
MKRISALSFLPILLGALPAQANTVAGLDGRLDVVDNFTYQGRRGAAHPNGEVGFAMLNTMCNPGSVVIPWQAAMQPNHPKFGFIAVRESGGRMVQISDRSYCKHAFTSTNFSGACGTCLNPGTGSLMGLRCSDTYGVGNNADRNWLGPAPEIDPWLGTWNPVGSYFDQGDPNVGPPGNNDGARSTVNTNGDEVKNRVTIRESELLVANARFFYGIHLIHQGESVANRGDNLASRGFNPTWNGSSWNTPNNSVGQVWGSVLQHWQGATLTSASNGNDDGRFFVAVKTSTLGGGQYRYEYAVHNVDNSRGGATFRVPLGNGAVTGNYFFRDIDTNALNDWTVAQVGGELVFTAPAGNSLDWNSIYNFGFDCNIAPGQGAVFLDEARIGAGALTVTVVSTIPGGMPVASVETVGTGCGGTQCTANVFYESFGSAAAFDLANSGLTMSLSGNTYQVGNGTGTFVPVSGSSVNLGLGDDTRASVALPFALPILGGTTNTLWVCSNGFVSTTDNGTSFTPALSGVTGGAYCWYGAWFDLNPAASGGGRVYVDSSPAMVRITWDGVYRYNTTLPNTFQLQFLPNGTVHVIWQTMNTGGAAMVAWTVGAGAVDPGPRDISATRAAGWSLCNGGIPNLALAAAPRPVLGSTVVLTTSNIPAGTLFGSVLLSFQQAVPPQDLTVYGMPGCVGHVVNGVSHLFVPGANPTSQMNLGIPSSTSFTGLPIVGQSFSYGPLLTPIGVIASNGVVLVIGQV